MSDKLREEIEEYLKKHKERLPDFLQETQLTSLLQRCLSEMDKGRWVPEGEDDANPS